MSLPDVDFAASTALVTGGSSGIGRAIAEELVARGIRQLILVARTGDKLSRAADEIESSTTGLTVRTIQANLTERDAPEKVQKEVQGWGWTVDILVNDAGLGLEYCLSIRNHDSRPLPDHYKLLTRPSVTVHQRLSRYFRKGEVSKERRIG
jgi:short-subunit dehydrogenase